MDNARSNRNFFYRRWDRTKIVFTATENTDVAREAKFTVAVDGGYHSKTVVVKQAGLVGGTTITINQSVLQSYYTQLTKNEKYSWLTHPPFDADGVDTAADHGITDINLSSTPTMTGSYTIQIERGQRSVTAEYANMQAYCSGLNEDGLSGWRLPTQIELHAMYKNKAAIEASASAFISSNWYWSSTQNLGLNYRCLLYFNDGSFGNNPTYADHSVRCVRNN